MRLRSITRSAYQICRYRDEEVWRSHQRIQEFLRLSRNCDEQTLEFLAQPVSKGNKIEWRSDFLSEALPMSQLSSVHKSACEQLTRHVLEQFKKICQEHPDWAGLLTRSIEIYSSDDVFYDSKKHRVCIVNWGAKRKDSSDSSTYNFSISNPPLCPIGEFVPPLSDKPEKKSEDTPEKTTMDQESTQAIPSPHSVVEPDPIEPSGQKSEQEPPTPTSPKRPLIPQQPSVNKQQIMTSDPIIDPEQILQGEHSSSIDASENVRGSHRGQTLPPSPPNEEKQRQGCMDKFKKYLWWILGLFFLLFLLLFLLSQCGRGNIPDKPGVYIPIAEEDIGYDTDSVCQIVTNRVNIYVEERGRVEEFMQAFIETYEQDKYSVLYYDTIVQRVQVLVPQEERELFKQELLSKMAGFKLIAWDESMLTAERIPTDPDFMNQDHSWYFDCVKAYGAWDKEQGDDSLIVSVVDNGFDTSHPELRDRVVDQYNVLLRKHIVLSDQADPHGTHVASTAVGTADNGAGVSGLAPKCKLMTVQVADENGYMTTTSVMDGIIYSILHGAKVINVSLGKSMPLMKLFSEADQINFMNSFGQEEAKIWDKIFAMAEENGATVVLAGGNEGILIGLDPMQRSSRAIKVSAMTADYKVADFSNYGYLSSISAPGVSIFNAFPNGNYQAIDGTSMAAPIVTGGIALIKSRYPNLSTGQIAELLRYTGKALPGNVGPLIQLDAALSAGESGDIGQISDPNQGLPLDESLPPTAPNFPGGPIVPEPHHPIKPDDPLNPFYPKPDAPTPPGRVPYPGRPKAPNNPCESIRIRIDSLRRVIQELESSCGNMVPQDSMRINEHTTLNDLSGHWRSTTSLYSSNQQEPIEVYFYIKPDGTGTITYLEAKRGIDFTAPISVTLGNETLNIVQQAKASNSEYPQESYKRYSFHCTAIPGGAVAQCSASIITQPNIRLIKFNMIRVSK